MKYVKLVTALVAGITVSVNAIPYQFMDDESDVAQKGKALLRQMTLDEKVGQMIQADTNSALHNTKKDIAEYNLGSVLSGGVSDASYNDALSWKKYAQWHKGFAAKTRLKIPVIYGIDAVNGHSNTDGATILPHNIALGATRNLKLFEESSRGVANEVAGTGIGWTFAPCITVQCN